MVGPRARAGVRLRQRRLGRVVDRARARGGDDAGVADDVRVRARRDVVRGAVLRARARWEGARARRAATGRVRGVRVRGRAGELLRHAGVSVHVDDERVAVGQRDDTVRDGAVDGVFGGEVREDARGRRGDCVRGAGGVGARRRVGGGDGGRDEQGARGLFSHLRGGDVRDVERAGGGVSAGRGQGGDFGARRRDGFRD